MTGAAVEDLGSIFADAGGLRRPRRLARRRPAHPGGGADPRGGAARLPRVLGHHQARRRDGDRAQPRRLHQRARARSLAPEGQRRRRRGRKPPVKTLDPDGRRRAQGPPGHRQRLVQARQRQADAGPGRRAGQALRRPDGRHGRPVRLRQRRRPALPAAGDPLDPRAARGRLRADAQAHPGAVRRRGPRHRPHGRGRVDVSRCCWTSSAYFTGAGRRPPGPPDRRPRLGHRQRRARRRAAAPTWTCSATT